MTEERLKAYVAEKGKNQECPFLVPEGYFDTLSTRIMAQLPEKLPCKPKRVSLVSTTTWRCAAAVSIIFVVVSAALLLPTWLRSHKSELSQAETELFWEEDDGFEEFNYEMVDNNEIAYYLTEN